MYMSKTKNLRAEYLETGEELSKFFGDQKCCTTENEHFWSPKNFDNSSPVSRYSALKFLAFDMYIGLWRYGPQGAVKNLKMVKKNLKFLSFLVLF